MDEKMFGQTLFFLLTFSTDKENTAEGWASPSHCAIFHHPGWKDDRMIKSPFLFHLHVRRWYETPIQVWETGVTKQLIKLNKPNSRAQISTAAGRSSLRLYLNYQGWASHSRAAVWAVMAVGNLHCMWSSTWLTGAFWAEHRTKLSSPARHLQCITSALQIRLRL